LEIGLLLCRFKLDDEAGAEAFAADEGFPMDIIQLFEEEKLDFAARGFAAKEPGGDDPAVVGDEDVAGVQEIYNVAKGVVGYLVRLPVDHQQAGGVTGFNRALGDALRR
jgi:hypothetical protein